MTDDFGLGFSKPPNTLKEKMVFRCAKCGKELSNEEIVQHMKNRSAGKDVEPLCAKHTKKNDW